MKQVGLGIIDPVGLEWQLLDQFCIHFVLDDGVDGLCLRWLPELAGKQAVVRSYRGYHIVDVQFVTLSVGNDLKAVLGVPPLVLDQNFKWHDFGFLGGVHLLIGLEPNLNLAMHVGICNLVV